KTVTQNLQGFSLRSLPLTLQHAILVTRALSLGYIWIDSLCIIQDSVSDWQKESSLMCDIYSNATVTISTDAALDCESGCFDADQHQNLTIGTIPCLSSTRGRVTNIYYRRAGFRQEANGAYATENLSRLRLDSRGWTLQERLLSPRVLHCTSTELV
ncbi:heterokaryon incompatibility, partial [Phaeosphaeriaceae sp. PMI808]